MNLRKKHNNNREIERMKKNNKFDIHVDDAYAQISELHPGWNWWRSLTPWKYCLLLEFENWVELSLSHTSTHICVYVRERDCIVRFYVWWWCIWYCPVKYIDSNRFISFETVCIFGASFWKSLEFVICAFLSEGRMDGWMKMAGVG